MTKLFKRKNDNKTPPTGRQPLRNRPVAESERNRAFSYYASRSFDETNTGRSASADNGRQSSYGRPRSFVSRVGTLAAAVFVLTAIASELSLSPNPKVVALSTSTSQVFLQNQAVYQRAATVLFRNSLASRNKLTVDTASISTRLRQEFPELSAVSVALPVLGHQPVVYMQPSEPSLVLVTQSSGSFVLDSNGRALAASSGAAAQLAKLHVPTVVDQSGLQVSTGQTALPNTVAQFIHVVAEQLTAQHIGFRSMALPRTAGELDVYIAGEPFYVKFNTEANSALQQTGAFVATFHSLHSRGVTPHQYIDVRIDGRAYYK